MIDSPMISYINLGRGEARRGIRSFAFYGVAQRSSWRRESSSYGDLTLCSQNSRYRPFNTDLGAVRALAFSGVNVTTCQLAWILIFGMLTPVEPDVSEQNNESKSMLIAPSSNEQLRSSRSGFLLA
jgi:hypothetical protein